MRQANLTWGKRRIADEVAKLHAWHALVTPNTVRRILQIAGLWNTPPEPPKKGFHTSVRTAEQPEQTVNIDVCFVPAIHQVTEKLPAVSGSSGRLIVEHRLKEKTDHCWPGAVFAQPDLDYHEAMQRFARSSHQRFCKRTYQSSVMTATQTDPRRPIRVQAAAVRSTRRNVRLLRQQEDEAWRTLWNARRAMLEARRCAGGVLAWTDDAEDVPWRALREQRHNTRVKRQAEDRTWRSEYHTRRQMLHDELAPIQWRAVLLVTDNCTRHCYELSLFASGGRVRAAEGEVALERVLPTRVTYVISDQGTHFMAKTFQQLAQRSGFVHGPIARHRPQSNGIAERCVRTLKEWLRDKVWNADSELSALLETFRTHYHDRPHQGRGIPELSPNEFAQRIWLL